MPAKGDITSALIEVMADSRDKARVLERALTQESAPAGAGGGTVTSVALTMPSIFSVAGSPITLSGTLAATLATQAANLVFAGPTSGGAATPTFRALVAADVSGLSGSGTVTSVALSLPAIFSVSGSPITAAGTLTATLATQTANYIWAGPVSGGAAAPAFRAMVAADVPNSLITYAKIQNMTTARLLGRTTAGSGVVEEISVGAGLTLTAGVLNTAAGGSITGSGTSGQLTKWTGASAIGDASIADIPQRVIVTRALTSNIGNYVQIGSWTAAVGSHNLRVSVTVENAGVTSIAKAFIVSTKYDQTAGAWHIVPALTDSGLYNADFQLIASQSGAALALRLYLFNGGGGVSSTYTIDMENVGYSTDVFAAASSASTMTAPTVTLASATDYHAIRGGITLVKTIPTTVGNYVEICQLVNGLGGNPFRISISNSDSGFSNSKQYVIASSYGATAGWVIVAPISDSKYTTAQDYELCINQGGGTTYFRLLRTVGTSSGTAYVQFQWDGAYAGAYGELTGTGSMTVPTTYAPHNMLTQVGGGVLIKGGYLSTDMDTMTYAATITLDVTLGNLHKTTTVNATGNATINASAVGKAGQPLWILIVNDATSGKVITFGTNFKSTGTLTGTVSKQATIHFISDGVSWSEVSRTLAL